MWMLSDVISSWECLLNFSRQVYNLYEFDCMVYIFHIKYKLAMFFLIDYRLIKFIWCFRKRVSYYWWFILYFY
jgi:hypothetical protein